MVAAEAVTSARRWPRLWVLRTTRVNQLIFAGDDHVYFFKVILSHVPYIQIAGKRVERKPERIAKAVSENFIHKALLSDEGIVGRNAVRITAVEVEPKNRAEQRRRILPVVELIIGSPTVTEPDEQESIGSKCDHSTVVIGSRLTVRKYLRAAVGVGHTGGAKPILDDRRRSVPCRVMNNHSIDIVRVKGDSKQALFS